MEIYACLITGFTLQFKWRYMARGAKVREVATPLEFWVLKLGGLKPPLILRIFKKIEHICYYVHRILKSGLFIA